MSPHASLRPILLALAARLALWAASDGLRNRLAAGGPPTILAVLLITLGCATGHPSLAMGAVVVAGGLSMARARPMARRLALLTAVTGIVLGATTTPAAPVLAMLICIALGCLLWKEPVTWGRVSQLGGRIALVFGVVAVADGLAVRGFLAAGPPEVWVDVARPLVVAGLLLHATYELFSDRIAGIGILVIAIGALAIAVTGDQWAYLLVPAGGVVGLLLGWAESESAAQRRLERQRAAVERRLPPTRCSPFSVSARSAGGGAAPGG